jgi:[ribosomal protein S5]-alanine N-acetyltransferase
LLAYLLIINALGQDSITIRFSKTQIIRLWNPTKSISIPFHIFEFRSQSKTYMNFTLRPWKLSDIDSLVKYANNPNIAQFMTDLFPHPYTKEKAVTFIEMVSSANPFYVFAIDVNGEAVGGIGIHQQKDIQQKNAELGYWLGEPFWGNGIMTNAVKQMLDYGFQNFDITRIFARPFGTNIASQKVLEKAGFVFEARFEKAFYKKSVFVDELIYSVRRNQAVK